MMNVPTGGSGVEGRTAVSRPYLVALGDSLGLGSDCGGRASASQGWAWRCAVLLQLGPDGILNLASRGATANEVADQQMPRARAAAPAVLNLCFGADAAARGDDVAGSVSLVGEILAWCLEAGCLAIVTLLPLSPTRSAWRTLSSHSDSLTEWQRSYNEHAGRCAERYGALVLDAPAITALKKPEGWTRDGTGISEQGQQHLASALTRLIKSRLTFEDQMRLRLGIPRETA